MNILKPMAIAAILIIPSLTNAAVITSDLFAPDGTQVGKIIFEDSEYGLIIKPALTNLPAGVHGFHIHEHPDCGDHGMKAGEHLDPAHTQSHQGPYGKGHLGDLPVLVVNTEGKSELISLAPRLKTGDIQKHAIMIHAGGDNYSDKPANGGGGDRIACGTIP